MKLTLTPPEERNFDFVADEFVRKLLLLFIFEKMEFALTDASMSEIIMSNPSWMNYMEYKDGLHKLCEVKYVHQVTHGSDIAYSITQDGRMALSHFYIQIPASIREEITDFAKYNRQKFRRNQEYVYDYFRNTDGTHTVLLRIKDGSSNDNLLEIRMKMSSRAEAVKAVNKWKSKAASVYETLHGIMLADERAEED